jgi:hypothetical protein
MSVATRRRRRRLQQLPRRLRLRQKSRREKRRGEGGGDAAAAGYKQLGSCAAGKMKIRLYVYRGKLILAAMYLRRVGIDGPIYAAACLTNGRWPRNKWKHNISEVVQQEK